MEQNRTIIDKAAGPLLIGIWLLMPTIGYLGGVPTANLVIGSAIYGAVLLMGHLFVKRIVTEMAWIVTANEEA